MERKIVRKNAIIRISFEIILETKWNFLFCDYNCWNCFRFSHQDDIFSCESTNHWPIWNSFQDIVDIRNSCLNDWLLRAAQDCLSYCSFCHMGHVDRNTGSEFSVLYYFRVRFERVGESRHQVELCVGSRDTSLFFSF